MERSFATVSMMILGEERRLSRSEDKKMIQFSSEQAKRFEQWAENDFLSRIKSFLQKEHHELVSHLSDEDLSRVIRYSIQIGRDLQFSWETALVAICVFVLEIGPGFENHPAFRRALDEGRSKFPNDENQRIFWIYDHTTDDDWEEAEEMCARASEDDS